jgi:hypothetical protein
MLDSVLGEELLPLYVLRLSELLYSFQRLQEISEK